MEVSFNLKANKAIIHQLKNQSQVLKSNKYKLDSLKHKLSSKFCMDYNTKAKIESCINLKGLIDKLYNKIDDFDKNH